MEAGDVKHEIEWAGFYEQFGTKHDVSFQNVQMTPEGKIEGGGKDPVGEFVIAGDIKGSDVHFDKAYKGAHTVKYTGKLDNGTISGRWDVGGASGGFEIKMKTKQWKGHFEKDGQLHDMLASIHIQIVKGKRCPIKGIGSDQNGNYSLYGFKPIIGDGHTVMFTKKYFSSNVPIHFSGTIGEFGGAEVMRGYWVMGTEFGTFELCKQP